MYTCTMVFEGKDRNGFAFMTLFLCSETDSFLPVVMPDNFYGDIVR